MMFYDFINFGLQQLSLLSTAYSGSCYPFPIVVFLVSSCATLDALQIFLLLRDTHTQNYV